MYRTYSDKHPYVGPHSQFLFVTSGRGCGEERGVRNVRERRSENEGAV